MSQYPTTFQQNAPASSQYGSGAVTNPNGILTPNGVQMIPNQFSGIPYHGNAIPNKTGQMEIITWGKLKGFIRTFWGTETENADGWMDQFQNWMMQNGLESDEEWRNHLPIAMRGQGYNWWWTTGQHFTSWRPLEKSFRMHFIDAREKGQWKKAFETCVQLTGERVQDYIFRLNSLANLAKITKDEEHRDQFVEGLWPQLQIPMMIIIESEPSIKYAKLVARCLRIEAKITMMQMKTMAAAQEQLQRMGLASNSQTNIQRKTEAELSKQGTSEPEARKEPEKENQKKQGNEGADNPQIVRLMEATENIKNTLQGMEDKLQRIDRKRNYNDIRTDRRDNWNTSKYQRIQHDKRNPNEPARTRNGQLICYNCKGEGHRAYNCPSKLSGNTTRF
jgi:hypothetical protein